MDRRQGRDLARLGVYRSSEPTPVPQRAAQEEERNQHEAANPTANQAGPQAPGADGSIVSLLHNDVELGLGQRDERRDAGPAQDGIAIRVCHERVHANAGQSNMADLDGAFARLIAGMPEDHLRG